MIKFKRLMSLVLAVALFAAVCPNGSGPVFAVDSEPTLTAVPAGVTPTEEFLGTQIAYVANDTVTVYEYYENGALGMVCTGALGEQIELTAKFTYTVDGVDTVIYHFAASDFTGAMGAADVAHYQFILASDVTFTAPEGTGPDISDPSTGVSVAGDLPEGVSLTVTPKTLAESGIDTTVYPISGASLFYDVTLLQNSAEYQPENGITVTFPEDAITNSGLAVGDYYKVYHVHDGATDVTGPFAYTGGAIEAKFDSLSVVGFAESETYIDLVGQHGGSYTVGEYLEPSLITTIKNDSVILYGSLDSNVYTATITGAVGEQIELVQQITYADGFVLYRAEYYGENSELDSAIRSYYFISADDVTILCCDICGEYTCDCANEETEVQEAFLDLMAAESLAEFESLMDALSDELRTKVEESSYWQKILVESYLHVYSHFYSTGTEEEFNAHAAKYPEAFAYIQADETLKYYNDKHLERIRYVAANPIVDSTITLGEIVYVTLPSYTNVAPKWSSPAIATEQVSPFTLRSAHMAAQTGATDPDGNGVGLSKTYDPDTGMIRLEVYSTGASVTTVTETEMPADIILVLDLSTSMINNSMDNVGYRALESGTAEDVYQNYDGSLYVEVDGSYKEVTITGQDLSSAAVYERYNKENVEAKEIYKYVTEGNDLYYLAEDGGYYKVSVSRTQSSGGGSRTYTCTYIDANGQSVQIYGVKGGDTNISTVYGFYTQTSAASYSSYVYTYTDANGQTVTNTYEPTDSIVSDDGPVYYVPYANGTISRAKALENAVTTFADQVATKAKGADGKLGTDDDVAHCIAIVGFNGSGNGSTGVYIGSTIDTYSDGVANTTYQTALQDMSTTAGVANVTASIGALKNEQGTYTYCGTDMANGILAAYANDENRYVVSGKTIRSKVVVIFTDGEPNGTDAYNAPIEDTWTMKNTYGATVYTVGILDDGDTTIPPTSNLNKFMHYMSSNYKDATSLTSPGELTATNGGYYLLAANSNDLNNIFSSISSSATSGGSLTKLSETTEVRDIISPYFMLPTDTKTEDIQLYTAVYNGPNDWGADTKLEGATVAIDGKKVSITGFDFSENWVGAVVNNGETTGYHGKKLVVVFPLAVEPEFLGGSGVITNDANSGIYDPANSDAVIEKFDVPTTNVPLKNIDTVVQDREIYLGNTIDLTDILNLNVTESASGNTLQEIADGVNNAYVDLVYTVTLSDQTVYTYTIPAGALWNAGIWKQGDTVVDMSAVTVTDSTQYGITCVMTDKNNSTNYKTASGTATIYVRKPQITFQDIEKIPNVDKVDYVTDNLVKVEWLDASDTVGTEGTEPVLVLTYTPDEGCVAADGTVISLTDFYVNVQVTLSGTDITADTAFVHESCSMSGCSFAALKGEFIIHVNRGTLTIRKTVTGTTEKDVFIFHIQGNDESNSHIDMDVTITGSGSVKICDLPLGSYTVTEDTDWSWRYTAKETSVDVVLSTDAEVTFTNNYDNSQWLNDVTKMPNTFGGNKVENGGS